jgi:CRP-like cAMP-binding protein
MHSVLFDHIAEKITLTRQERELCKKVFIPKSIRRRQYLLQEGDPCKHMFFVSKGALRSYTIDDKGEEHIVQFAIENWWITDLYSFLTGEASTNTIDAIEDSDLILLDHPSYEMLFQQIPKFEHYFRVLLQNNFIAMRKRLIYTISSSAEERYEYFLHEHPSLAQRVPQHMVASYLGITPETLSRVRKQLSARS